MDVIMDVNKSLPWAMTGQKCGEILISSDQLIFRSNKTKFYHGRGFQLGSYQLKIILRSFCGFNFIAVIVIIDPLPMFCTLIYKTTIVLVIIRIPRSIH